MGRFATRYRVPTPESVGRARVARARVSRAIGALAIGVVAIGGCTPDFDDVTLVKDLRVLGLRAKPPEQILFRTLAELPPELLALLGQGGGSLPVAIPGIMPTRLEALVVDPRADVNAAFDWQVWGCSADSVGCADAGYKVKLEQRRGPLSQISYDFTPNGALFEQAFRKDSFLGFGGLPIAVELRIFDPQAKLWVKAIKRVVYTFWLPYSPVPENKRPNANPEFERIRLTIKDADAKDLRKLNLRDISGPLELRRDQSLVLEPSVTAASRETYEQIATAGFDAPGTTPPQTVVQVLEECDKGEKKSTDPKVECGTFMVYQFYTTAGSLSHAETGGATSLFFEDKKVKDPSSEWLPPQPDPNATGPLASEATIWIVLRDGRGGGTWRSLDVKMTEVP